MILTDFSAVAISATINSAMREKMSLDEMVVKHITFSTFRNIHKALGNKYGRHLLLCDSRSWRKDSFEFYKANRKLAKDDNQYIDWEMIYRVMDELQGAFDEHFPFDVIKTKGCEADDLIAAFAKKAQEPTIIVSKDKDFYQLHNRQVQQWDWSKKKLIEVADPAEYRLEHIIRGDGSDGIPNVLSDDDTFVISGKSQTMMTQKRVEEMVGYARNDFKDAPKKYVIRKEIKKSGIIFPEISCDPRENWSRNKLLIDLMEPVQSAIDTVDKYNTSERKVIQQNDTASYLASQKMVVLLGKISDFYKGSNKQKGEAGPLSKFM